MQIIQRENTEDNVCESIAIVRRSNEKLISYILATEYTKELKAEIAKPPNAFLNLEYIFGINTAYKNGVQYLHDKCLTEGKEWIIYTATKYIIIESPANVQRIYENHESMVNCFACSDVIASADLAGNIHFWSPHTMQLLKIKKLPIEGSVGEYMDFSGDGKLLLIVIRPSQSLLVLDWKQDREVTFKNIKDTIQITKAKFDPANSNRIIVIGKETIIEYSLVLGSINCINYCSVLIDEPKYSILLCMDFMEVSFGESDVYIGTSGGDIGILINNQFERLTHEPVHTGAINSIKVLKDLYLPACIITAGDDNAVRVWDISLNLITSISVPELSIYTSTVSKQCTEIPSAYFNGITSLDILNIEPNKRSILIALRCGDVIKIEIQAENYSAEKFLEGNQVTYNKIIKEQPESSLLIRGHSFCDERKVCIVPIDDTDFLISSGDDSTLRLWNLSNNSLIWTEDLGKSRNLKVSCLGYSPLDSVLVVGFRSGMVVYYKLTVVDFLSELPKVPKIALKSTSHDFSGPVLKITFSCDCNFLAISYGPNTSKEGGGVFLYLRNKLKTAKELYLKMRFIEVPIPKSNTDENLVYAAIDMEFAVSNNYLQLCYLPIANTGRINYNKEPICTVWDLERDVVAEDWAKLINISWNNFAFSPSISIKNFPLMKNITLTCIKFFGKENLSCAGSSTGDIHLLRKASILTDKKSLKGIVNTQQEESIAKSQQALCSYINSLHIISKESEQWVIITAIDDALILKYRITYEDYKWNLDYLEPITIIEDPYKEFPSKEKFRLLIYGEWNKRLILNKEKSDLLEANWVFGRRACDRRNNLKFDYLGRAVYSVGTMLIIVNDPIKSFVLSSENKTIQQIILNSTSENPVFPEISCIAMSKSRRIVGFGTAELQAHVHAWNISSNTEIAVCPINHCSIICSLKFHINEAHVIALGLSKDYQQVISIVDLMEGVELCRATQIHSLVFKIRDLDFCPGETHTRFVTCGIQHLSFWHKNGKYVREESANFFINPKVTLNFASTGHKKKSNESLSSARPGQYGALGICKDVGEGDKKTVFATFLALGFVGQTLLTVADDGFVYIWEYKSIVRKREGHSGLILSLDIHESNQLVVTGGADGKVILWSFNEKSVHGHADLEKIRSIGFKSEILDIQSVAINGGILMIGTKTGSVYILNVVDSKGNIKPKQSGTEEFKPLLEGIDNERPGSVAYDPLNDRLCCLTESGLFVVISVSTQNFLYSKNYSSRGITVDILRSTGNIMLVFENEVIFLTGKYELINEMSLKKMNITAARLANNNLLLAVASVKNGDVQVAMYKVSDCLNEIHVINGYNVAIANIDFTIDDNYISIADELGDIFTYEVKDFMEVKDPLRAEAELEWQSWGFKADPEFIPILKNYTQDNKVSSLTRVQNKKDNNLIAVGDQSGVVSLYISLVKIV